MTPRSVEARPLDRVNIVERDGAVTFAVRVIPRASKTGIVGKYDGGLKIRISSPPVDGAANAELIRLFAKHFGVSKGDITIIIGETSKNKRIRIENLSSLDFEELIK